MSSADVGVDPVSIAVAAGALVVIAAAAAAVMVVRAANAAAEAAVRAVGAYGERLEAEAAGRSAVEAAALRWQCAAADAVALNARIRLLSQRAHAGGEPVDLPPPLDLAGRTVAEVRAWAVATERTLAAAQRALDGARADHEWAALVAGLPHSPGVRADGSDTAAALRRYQASLADRYEVSAPAPTAHRDDVESILAALDPDANDAERALALTAAVKVHRADPSAAAAYRLALRRKIYNDINPKVARRRLAAEWLQALDEPAVVDALSGEEAVHRVAADLRAVVAGTRDLTPELRTRSVEALARAQEAVQQRFLRDLVRRSLVDQGYRVDAEFDVRHHIGMRLSHPDWQGEHTADVWIDPGGTVHGRVDAEAEARGDDAVRRGLDRCEKFTGDIGTVGDRLVEAGVTATVATDPRRRPQARQAPGAALDAAARQMEPPRARQHGGSR